MGSVPSKPSSYYYIIWGEIQQQNGWCVTENALEMDDSTNENELEWTVLWDKIHPK